MGEDHPQRPINSYGETKLAVERALPHYERAYGIRWVALRYFNAAGADPDGVIGEDHTPEIHLIPRAIDATMGAEPLALFGDDYPTPDGTCLRDYIHVQDLADAHLRALGRLEDGGASAAYNLGTGTPASVREILTSVERVTGRAVPHAVKPRREGDPPRCSRPTTKSSASWAGSRVSPIWMPLSTAPGNGAAGIRRGIAAPRLDEGPSRVVTSVL